MVLVPSPRAAARRVALHHGAPQHRHHRGRGLDLGRQRPPALGGALFGQLFRAADPVPPGSHRHHPADRRLHQGAGALHVLRPPLRGRGAAAGGASLRRRDGAGAAHRDRLDLRLGASLRPVRPGERPHRAAWRAHRDRLPGHARPHLGSAAGEPSAPGRLHHRNGHSRLGLPRGDQRATRRRRGRLRLSAARRQECQASPEAPGSRGATPTAA